MNKLSVVHDALNDCLARITSPEQLLPLAIAKSAKQQNICLHENDIKCLTSAMLKAEGDVIQLDLDLPCAFGATEREVQDVLQGLVDQMVASLTNIENDLVAVISEVVPDTLAKVAELVGENISKEAIEHTLHLRKAYLDRVESVQQMWGNAIEQLDFLRHIVLEWDSAAKQHCQGAYATKNTSFALNRLVARAYEVVGEIIVLVRAGYADGALARWRSLHEICVIAMFLARQSDKCAKMYLSHHCVEELRLFGIDVSSGTARAMNVHRDRYARELRMKTAAMVNKFGTAFSKDYGWASVELGRGKVTFRDLESRVGLETLRRGYQLANSTVHGGALATLTRISLGPNAVAGAEIPPALGCEVAANYAAASLSMMIAELCLDSESADLLTMSMVVHNCAIKMSVINQFDGPAIKLGDGR